MLQYMLTVCLCIGACMLHHYAVGQTIVCKGFPDQEGYRTVSVRESNPIQIAFIHGICNGVITGCRYTHRGDGDPFLYYVPKTGRYQPQEIKRGDGWDFINTSTPCMNGIKKNSASVNDSGEYFMRMYVYNSQSLTYNKQDPYDSGLVKITVFKDSDLTVNVKSCFNTSTLTLLIPQRDLPSIHMEGGVPCSVRVSMGDQAPASNITITSLHDTITCKDVGYSNSCEMSFEDVSNSSFLVIVVDTGIQDLQPTRITQLFVREKTLSNNNEEVPWWRSDTTIGCVLSLWIFILIGIACIYAKQKIMNGVQIFGKKVYKCLLKRDNVEDESDPSADDFDQSEYKVKDITKFLPKNIPNKIKKKLREDLRPYKEAFLQNFLDRRMKFDLHENVMSIIIGPFQKGNKKYQKDFVEQADTAVKDMLDGINLNIEDAKSLGIASAPGWSNLKVSIVKKQRRQKLPRNTTCLTYHLSIVNAARQRKPPSDNSRIQEQSKPRTHLQGPHVRVDMHGIQPV